VAISSACERVVTNLGDPRLSCAGTGPAYGLLPQHSRPVQEHNSRPQTRPQSLADFWPAAQGAQGSRHDSYSSLSTSAHFFLLLRAVSYCRL
jgi:hypothetical protein